VVSVSACRGHCLSTGSNLLHGVGSHWFVVVGFVPLQENSFFTDVIHTQIGGLSRLNVPRLHTLVNRVCTMAGSVLSSNRECVSCGVGEASDHICVDIACISDNSNTILSDRVVICFRNKLVPGHSDRSLSNL